MAIKADKILNELTIKALKYLDDKKIWIKLIGYDLLSYSEFILDYKGNGIFLVTDPDENQRDVNIKELPIKEKSKLIYKILSIKNNLNKK